MKNEQQTGIQGDALYTLREFQARMGLEKAAWRSLKRKGLPTIKQGRRVYISGRAAIEWFEAQTAA